MALPPAYIAFCGEWGGRQGAWRRLAVIAPAFRFCEASAARTTTGALLSVAPRRCRAAGF